MHQKDTRLMSTKVTVNRSFVLRYAWLLARAAATAAGESVRLHIGAAMRRSWAEAKAAAAALVQQPIQQQQANAATSEGDAVMPEPAPAPVHHTTVEGLRTMLVGRTAKIDLPMGEVTYRIVGVRRWSSPDGTQVRDYIDVEDEGMARDDRKGPKGIHIVQIGTSRGERHDSPVGQVRFSYGSFCNSGSKRAAADRLIEDLFAVAMPEPAPAMVAQQAQQQQANAGIPTSGACEVCGRPLTDPVSIEAGIGPVCRAHGHTKRQLDIFDNRSDYTVEILGDVICVVDLDKGARSVTNDASGVIRDLVAAGHDLVRMPVIYRDSSGRWDEMIVRDNAFAGFRAFNSDRERSLRKIAGRPPREAVMRQVDIEEYLAGGSL